MKRFAEAREGSAEKRGVFEMTAAAAAYAYNTDIMTSRRARTAERYGYSRREATDDSSYDSGRSTRRRLYASRRREARLRRMIIFLLIILAACFFALFATASRTEAQKMSEPSYKYYTSITVDAGDTLWTIAERYMTDEYRDIDEYMSEVATINHLRSEQLTRGQTLCIPYYSSEYKN